MGELINLNPPKTLTDADIPELIARDTEIAAAIAGHTIATDPHPTYLTQAKFLTSDFFFQVSAPNLIGNTWQELGPFVIIGESNNPLVWLITLYFQYSDGNSLIGYWQYCGAGILGCIFWKAASKSDGWLYYCA